MIKMFSRYNNELVNLLIKEFIDNPLVPKKYHDMVEQLLAFYTAYHFPEAVSKSKDKIS